MQRVSGDMLFDEEGNQAGFLLNDGKTFINHIDGCDHRDNPAKALNRLAKTGKKLKLVEDKDYEVIEICDGSDTLWYGLLML